MIFLLMLAVELNIGSTTTQLICGVDRKFADSEI